MAEAVVLVEGESDRVAVETVAALLGRDLVGVRIEVLGGATNVGHVLGTLGESMRVLGLYDEPEERWFCNGLRRAGFGKVHDRDDLETLGFFACVRDLEDELIRALGATRVRDVIEMQGELASLLTLSGSRPSVSGRLSASCTDSSAPVRDARRSTPDCSQRRWFRSRCRVRSRACCLASERWRCRVSGSVAGDSGVTAEILCVAKQVTRPIRNREVLAMERQ